MTSEMETNIVAVERVKEYSETPTEVLTYSVADGGRNMSCAFSDWLASRTGVCFLSRELCVFVGQIMEVMSVTVYIYIHVYTNKGAFAYSGLTLTDISFLFYPCLFQAVAIIESHRPPRDWPADGHVKFNHYSTRYREGLNLVLKDISVDIPGGTKVSTILYSYTGRWSICCCCLCLEISAS